MSEGPPEETGPTRTPCLKCREPLDPMAMVCPHCRQDASVDLVLAQPLDDSRLRYGLARDLVALSPKPGLGAWVRLLERGGVIMRGVPAGVAEPVRQRLGALGQVATLQVHKASRPAAQWLLLSGGAALALIFAVVLALGFLRRNSPAGSNAPGNPPAQGAVVANTTPANSAKGGSALSPREVADKVMPSVVVLRCQQQSGSGFFIAEHRLLSNQHVTCGRDEPVSIEMANGTKGEARVIADDERLDLAVLETSLRGTPLPNASAGALATGDTVMAAGAPMGLDRSFNVGTVSNARRIMLGVCYLQVDARINPGNSGGPLVDGQGKVVGVVSMKQNKAEGIAFAVPIDYAFGGDNQLLTAPDWYPTPGFKDMLEAARRDDERLQEESMRMGMRLVHAAPSGRGSVIAVVVTNNYSAPEQVLVFHFEQNDQMVCKVEGNVTWMENRPTQGMAKRAREWMERTGIGKVYSGITNLSVRDCQFQRGSSIDLVLEEGDEKTNRVSL